MVKKLLFFSYILTLISCNQGGDECAVTWLGGEIVNPKLDHVLLFKGEQLIDTIALDDDNFFLYEGRDLQEGLYSFRHFEYQIFYIKPGDSLMLRVNTVDFDESLTYSGVGAERNNLLIEMFLINETEDDLMPQMYLLTPEEFNFKLDSLQDIRLGLYNDFLNKNEASKGFMSLMQANIDYDFYSRKEQYTSVNYSNPRFDEPGYLPSDFYNYRNKVDFGNEDLRAYYSYFRFLNRYFDNLAYEEYRKTNYLDRKSYLHAYHKLHIIDSLVANDSLKNSMLRTNMQWYLLNAKDEQNEQEMVDLFHQVNTNKKHHSEIDELAAATMKLTPNHEIPNVMLLTADNTVKDLHSCFNRPSVLYFWSTASIKHFKNIHSRAAELRDKYPEYDFIGINTDEHFKNWRNVVRSSGYDTQREYQFENREVARKKLVINSMNKAIIVDRSGMILEGNTNLFNREIEDQLLGFLNKSSL